MPKEPNNTTELGYYYSLAQVGLEMVVPLGIGLVLDHYLQWTPWGVIAGMLLGFVGGLAHLILLVNRHDAKKDEHDA